MASVEASDDADARLRGAWAGEAHRTIALRPVPGKGLALVAARPIAQGTRILAEGALLSVAARAQADLPRLERAATESLARGEGAEARRRAFFSLHRHFAPELSPTLAVLRSNALPTHPVPVRHGDDTLGIFPLCNTLNHACRPNAELHWLHHQRRLGLHALRDIDAGHEITVAYTQTLAGCAERRRLLRARFLFDCRCDLCLLPPPLRRESDDRRRRLRQLDAALARLETFATPPRPALALMRTMLDLLAEEGIGGSRVARLYYDACQVAALHGDERRARVFAERSTRARVSPGGEDALHATYSSFVAKDPTGHRLFGRLQPPPARSSPDDEPPPEDSPDFDDWLWMGAAAEETALNLPGSREGGALAPAQGPSQASGAAGEKASGATRDNSRADELEGEQGSSAEGDWWLPFELYVPNRELFPEVPHRAKENRQATTREPAETCAQKRVTKGAREPASRRNWLCTRTRSYQHRSDKDEGKEKTRRRPLLCRCLPTADDSSDDS